MRLDSLDLTFAHGPGSYPGRYADQVNQQVFSLTVAHSTAMLGRKPIVRCTHTHYRKSSQFNNLNTAQSAIILDNLISEEIEKKTTRDESNVHYQLK